MCEVACKGYCCRRFFLPFDYETLKGMANGTIPNTYNKDEIDRVASMVVYLGKSTKDTNMKECGLEQNWYTCIYLDKKTGQCTDYAGRPKLCSDYPYGGECQYHKCSAHPWWRRYDWARILHRKVFGWTTKTEKEQRSLGRLYRKLKGIDVSKKLE
jgi:Fe-S-cluster containining protein